MMKACEVSTAALFCSSLLLLLSSGAALPSADQQTSFAAVSRRRSGHTSPLLNRRKRFVAFPEGSTFSTAICMTTGVIGNPQVSYLSMGLNWGIAYDLPNATWVLRQAHGFRRPASSNSSGQATADGENRIGAAIGRRHRRELYNRLETIISSMGYEGRDCVLRALCESRQYFDRTKMGMIGEMLRVIFSLPKQRIFSRELLENDAIKDYDHAYRATRSTHDCARRYPCGFSLLQLALGRYATPPPGYYKQH